MKLVLTLRLSTHHFSHQDWFPIANDDSHKTTRIETDHDLILVDVRPEQPLCFCQMLGNAQSHIPTKPRENPFVLVDYCMMDDRYQPISSIPPAQPSVHQSHIAGLAAETPLDLPAKYLRELFGIAWRRFDRDDEASGASFRQGDSETAHPPNSRIVDESLELFRKHPLVADVSFVEIGSDETRRQWKHGESCWLKVSALFFE